MLVSSTGVIGEKLNVSTITNSLSELKENLSVDGGLLAAEAIMMGADFFIPGFS